MRGLADRIEYNTWNARRVMPHFGQDVFLKAQVKGPLSSAARRNARAQSRRMARELGIDAAVAKHKLDALVADLVGPAFEAATRHRRAPPHAG